LHKGASNTALDGKIYVFRNVANRLSEPERVQLSDDNPYDIPALVHKWAAAAPGLNRRGDVKESRVVLNPGQGAYCSRCNLHVRRQQPSKRKPGRNHGFSGANRQVTED